MAHRFIENKILITKIQPLRFSCKSYHPMVATVPSFRLAFVIITIVIINNNNENNNYCLLNVSFCMSSHLTVSALGRRYYYYSFISSFTCVEIESQRGNLAMVIELVKGGSRI